MKSNVSNIQPQRKLDTEDKLDIKGNSYEMPSMLDQRLYQKIDKYREKPGNSYASLSKEITRFVKDQYSDCWGLVQIGQIDQTKLEKSINDQIPGETYIRQYCQGRPICFRYTNTLANFFELEYQIRNFDPAKDFKIHNVLQSG